MGRAIVLGITGPIRAGKGLTTSTFVRTLHADRINSIIKDNPGFLEDAAPFVAEGSRGKSLGTTDTSKLIGSKIRGGTSTLWQQLQPDQRVALCMDCWNKCEHLNLNSVGISSWHREWAKDAFHVISQDCYLFQPDGVTRFLNDVKTLRETVEKDPSSSPWIIVEGFNILEEQWSPQQLLPLLDHIVVLHATKDLIMSRDPKKSPEANEAAWNKECAPYLAQLQIIFPQLAGPETDLKKEDDGQWHCLTSVNSKAGIVSGLNLHVAQFSAPGSKGASSEVEMEEQVQIIVKQVIQQVQSIPSAEASAVWKHFPGRNCYDGRGGTNVNLPEDNKHPKKMSVDEAKSLCEQSGYAGFTYEPAAGRMWRLKEVGSESEWSTNAKYDVYVRGFS